MDKQLKKYILITFALTWTLWWGNALLVKLTSLQENNLLPMILFTMGGFGPTIAALFCMEDKLSVKGVINFIFRCNIKSTVVLVVFLIMEIATFGLSSMERNSQISVGLIPLIILQAIVVYGGNEELGWRGIMQPLMQKKLSYPIATLIVGIVWAIWHLPLWFIKGNSHQGSSFIVFAILAILLCYWLSAVKNCNGSVFFCMVMHGITNTLLSVFVIKVNWLLITGLIVMTILANYISMKKLRMNLE